MSHKHLAITRCGDISRREEQRTFVLPMHKLLRSVNVTKADQRYATAEILFMTAYSANRGTLNVTNSTTSAAFRWPTYTGVPVHVKRILRLLWRRFHSGGFTPIVQASCSTGVTNGVTTSVGTTAAPLEPGLNRSNNGTARPTRCNPTARR